MRRQPLERNGASALLAAVGATLLGVASTASAREPGSFERVAAQLAELYDAHALVAIGEMHRNGQQHELLRRLLRDPRFVCRVDDIVVEFGNSRLQPLADAYVSGAPTTEAELASLWRETEVPFVWNSPVYREFYATVREINAARLCPHPVRLVLGDAPIDWSKVRTAEDLRAVPGRDASFADVVEREVLDRRHKGLIVAGGFHALKGAPRGAPTQESASQILERRHPGALFSIAPVPSAAAAELYAMRAAPSFRRVRGGPLERAAFDPIGPGWRATLVEVNGRHEWKRESSSGWPPLGEVTDGLLFYGGDATALFPPPAIYLEPGYQDELRRRAAIIKAENGQDFVTVLDELVEEARRAAR